GLIGRLGTEQDADRRREYAALLTRVYKKLGPTVYWGYRPPPRPPNTVAWERTEAIEKALDRVLADPEHAVRLAILKRVQREAIPARLATLGRWLREEHQADSVAAILDSLRARPAKEVRGYLGMIAGDKKHSTANRLTALALFAGGLDPANESQLLKLAGEIEEGLVLAELLRRIGQRPGLGAAPLLSRNLTSPAAEVRTAAVEALTQLRVVAAGEPIQELLKDKDARVRSAAATAMGKFGVTAAAAALLKLVRDADPSVRRASLEALRSLREPGAVPLALAALADRQTELVALDCVGDLGGPDQATAVSELSKRNPSTEVLPKVVAILNRWISRTKLPAARRLQLNRAVAEVQGANGVLLRWHVLGPVPAQAGPQIIMRFALPQPSSGEAGGHTGSWRSFLATGTESPVMLDSSKGVEGDAVWHGYTDVRVD
ncbi:MAG TPA: HEAT repeat domain-containing protein, partial [Gemmataceae bacterium]|nr:HEAT repeat domain-containing protein [Gemmataceae bacterium]